ncbi:small ribosomal subunit protein uS13c-like isoform X1 [Arachis hypogaea]|uniref:small ribosomal subunit protein uS13c-like isoform X1 n=2 Tax=Arachis hypogaea TaxID=3818 RepID=UPI003B211258
MDNKVTKDLSEEDLITLRDEVSKYVIEGDLRRFNVLNIWRLKANEISVVGQQRKKKNNSSMAQTLAMPIAPSLALISNSRPLSRAVYFPVLNPPKVRELSIECARVGGVEIPNNKRIEFSLQYIHGIRRSRARKILCDISMDNKVTKDLSEEDLITLRDEVSKYVIEGDLRRFNALNIRRLKEIQCYRGIRHIQGLPCRGQRTKNNCRTLKGKKVAIAGKKKK